jgi:hypothetical protein
MSFHGCVRAVRDRLLAMLLVTLLAGPGVAPWRLEPPGERSDSSAADTGMGAPPGPMASAVVPVSPPAAMAAPSLVTPRVVVALLPLAGSRLVDRRLGPGVSLRTAPTILRI